MSTTRIIRRVLIVEDHSVVAELMADALDDEHGLECVGIAADAPAALEIAAESAPDTVLLDVQLPSIDGIELMAHLRAMIPGLRAILLTAQPRLDRERAALSGGAVGYLGKDARLADVLAAVRDASADDPARDPKLAARSRSAASAWTLSPREREVLDLLAAGQHAQDIAHQLGLSMHTTRDYVKTLLKKLGARSQLEAVALASREGLVRVGAP